jgi:hypothetical protein
LYLLLLYDASLPAAPLSEGFNSLNKVEVLSDEIGCSIYNEQAGKNGLSNPLLA